MVREPLRLPLAFFASGMAALLFQVLWFRALGRVLGNTVWAGTLVLTAFMFGMAIGGLLAARLSPRIRNPGRAFALAEATVGVTGSLLVWGLPVLEPIVGPWLYPLVGQPGASAGARLGLALIAMLLPTIAMGMTLALGVRAIARDDTARSLGVLYAANTFGACIAPLFAEYYLIGTLGLRGTALVAAGLNAVAAALALAQPPVPSSVATLERGEVPHFPKRLLFAAALAGGLALALEVIWFRLLILYAPGTDATFALMLTVVLLGIAIGGALAPQLARLPFAWVTVGSSLAVVAGYVFAGRGFSGKDDLVQYAIPLMLPAAILSGSLFTLLGANLRAGSKDPQPAIGMLTTANTLGAALGAALAGLVMLPRFGIEWSLFALAAGYAVLPLLVATPKKMVLPFVVALAGLALFPFGRMEAHLAAAALPYQRLDGSKVVQVTQGPVTTLQLMKVERFGEPAAWRLLTDSYSMTAINSESIRYMQMFAWLPLALHPDPKRALLISYGAGNTAQALLSDPQLQRLTIVDVSPEITGASPTIHPQDDPLKDPRTQLVLEDGRHYLRVHPDKFDIVTAEPPPPIIAGVVNLYTREYFEAVAERLAPGGIATYWLPVPQFRPEGARAVTRAFCEVFPDCTLWVGGTRDWILMGGRDFKGRASAEHFTRLWRDSKMGPMISASGLENPAQLGATFLGDAAQLRKWYEDTPPLTDDHPKRMAPDTLVERSTAEYAAWLRVDGARARFQASPWIAQHWPEGISAASVPYFAVQPAFNRQTAIEPLEDLPRVDEILRHTQLQVPVLWLLGSDVVEQEIVGRRMAAGGYVPAFAYPLGVRALAQRDYAKAAERFTEAAREQAVPAGALAAYALCRQAKGAEASAIPGADKLQAELRCW